MMTLHQHKIPDSEKAKCLLACVYKKAKWMDAKGMFDVETVHGLVEKEHFDDATKQEASKKLIDICKKVNDETVPDGEKGCERGALLTTCLTENAPKVGLNLIV
ncbi:PBP/GOBP family domain-containing protein [Phthorimaea operculella]|nr:PBP/GOBP family domain-containing protein [Phthorimaea operculella]